MRISGKALPPRAALLLTLDFASLVVVTPLLFVLPLTANLQPTSWSHTLGSIGRLMLAGLACQATFYYNELYNLQIVRETSEVCARVFRSFALLLLILAVISILLPAVAPVLPRVLLFIGVLGGTAVGFRILALPHRRERVLVLGEGDEAEEVRQAIRNCPEWNLEVLRSLPALESFDGLSTRTNGRMDFDRVIVAEPQRLTLGCLGSIVDWKLKGLAVEDSQAFLERSMGRVRVEGLTYAGCISSAHYANGQGKLIVKRLLDLGAASLLILLTLPVMLVVAILILSQRDGDITYTQQRTGLHGEPFTIYKFRSMSPVKRSAHQQPERWASEEKHRVTALGRILRKYRLDELPQLVNVLMGDMSLVGPRPEQPSLRRALAEQIPFYEQRHSVPPGLTGWAQVRYGYGATLQQSRRKLEYDLFYVKHLSLWLDCAILIETVKVVCVGRGAM